MKTVVLDDDPTGTQSAIDVHVLLDWTTDDIRSVLRDHDSLYLQTNSRALEEDTATALIDSIVDDVRAAVPDERVRFVLRGDSTLRGHVFAEAERLLAAADDPVMVFVPAFPAGGRTTRGGVHYVRIDGVDRPAHETEYADDPVFPFASSNLADYVREKSGRRPFPVTLDAVRGAPSALLDLLLSAPVGSVVVPDAVTDDDVVRIADAIRAMESTGRSVVVRCAAPLAAELAEVRSTGLLELPLVAGPVATLVVCGSHTAGASRQLNALEELFGSAVTVDTPAALLDPEAAGEAAAAEATLRGRGGAHLTVVASDRTRRPSDNGLYHGERVMSALIAATRTLAPQVEAVIAKGGITSSQIARDGLGATGGFVLGQILPGVSLWRIDASDGRSLLYAVVPGNVGDASTLVAVAAAFGHTASE